MTDSCPNFQAIIVAQDGNKILVARTRCKMWTCPYCAQINQKMWRARIIEHIENSDDKWTWFTLTAHSKARGELSLKNIRGAWDRLIKRMKRLYGKFQYCRVYERHKDGSYHLHAIASFHFGDIKERKARKDGTKTKYSVWLKKNASGLKLGYYTHADDIEKDHSGYIASYVTKYMTKLSDVAYAEFGRIRRIQVSQGWAKWKKDSVEMWQVTNGIFESDMWRAAESGYAFVDISTGEQLSYDNFIDHVIYPPEFDSQLAERTALYNRIKNQGKSS
jgi:hypothetical protein